MNRYRTIKRNGKSYSEHRWVWEQAHGPIPEGHVVHHKNGDTFDNRLENLECMTHEQHSKHHNQIHAVERECDWCGRTYAPHPTKRARSKTCSRRCFRRLAGNHKRGARNPQSKLTANVVREARRRREDGEALKDLATEYGVSSPGLSQAVNGVTWAHIE